MGGALARRRKLFKVAEHFEQTDGSLLKEQLAKAFRLPFNASVFSYTGVDFNIEDFQSRVKRDPKQKRPRLAAQESFGTTKAVAHRKKVE